MSLEDGGRLSAASFPPPNPKLIDFDDEVLPPLRRRHAVAQTGAVDALLDGAEQLSAVEQRRQRVAYRWSVARRWRDARDNWRLDHPHAEARCCRVLWWTLALVACALTVHAFTTLTHDRVAAADTMRVAAAHTDERLAFVRSPPYDFTRRCAVLPTRREDALDRIAALVRVREATERKLTQPGCACAPMFGVPARMLSLRVGNATVLHAYNASVVAVACDNATAIEHWYNVESMARFFVDERANVERVRAECVRVNHVDGTGRLARLTLDGDMAACAQICADLFDGRTVYDGVE